MSYCHWWCPKCKQEVSPSNVSYQEHHETCGSPVEWIHVETTQELIPRLEREVEAARAGLRECLASWDEGGVDGLHRSLPVHSTTLARWRKAAGIDTANTMRSGAGRGGDNYPAHECPDCGGSGYTNEDDDDAIED
jgi:hypothetical protein